jgi:steroid delta-isomerase-like uncharacterized protein
MDLVIQRQRDAVADHLARENAHDWASVVASFTAPDPVFELVPAGARLHGIDGVASAYRILSTALPDVHVAEVQGWDVPGCSVREVVLTGTHTGEYFGLPGAGRRVRAEMACFFEFDEEGRLRAERVYFDNARLLAQMRGELTVEESC